VTAAAALAYVAMKTRERKILADAVKKGLTVRPNVINPLLAFAGGTGTGVAGKLLWDKYNKENSDWR